MLRSVLAGIVIAVAGIALAQGTPSVSRIVRDAEAAEFRFDDQTYSIKINLYEGGNLTREIDLEVLAKGSDKLLVRVIGPGEVAGMAILQLGRSTTYVYNPEDRSVRLVAASARIQGFCGTDWGAAETSLAGISRGFDATLVETTGDYYTVRLDRTTADFAYDRIIFRYDREHRKASKVEYYLDGDLMKTLVRDQWREQHGVSEPTRFRITNAKVDRVTEAVISEWHVNTGLEDRLFTRRSLMLGE